jgi:molybdopterin converting factor small subunit
MKITFYGRLSDAVGRELDLVVEEPCTISRLRQRIAGSFPAAASLLEDRRVRACVMDELVPDDHRVGETDAVEFLAPVSGG